MNEQLSAFDLADLKWKQKTIRASKFLKIEQRMSFEQWMDDGKKRFDWPGWEILCGPKPIELVAQKKLTERILNRRMMA